MPLSLDCLSLQMVTETTEDINFGVYNIYIAFKAGGLDKTAGGLDKTAQEIKIHKDP